MKTPFATLVLFLFLTIATVSSVRDANACTCITLEASDGAVVVGRTMEWAAFDVDSKVVVIPRDCEFTSELEGGRSGVSWKTTHGVVGFDYLDRENLIDGMNEKGLVVNGLYHPGYASYPPLDPAQAGSSIEVTDVPLYLLAMCASTKEVRDAINAVSVVATPMAALGGIQPPLHFLVTEPSGKAIVIEFLERKIRIFDAPLGVLTNAPTYDWHMTNLRNYLGFSAAERSPIDVRGAELAPLGHGTGAIGLPGDMTPPSRFVRAAAFSASARPTKTGPETMYEAFRILDNFNVPIGAVKAGKEGDDGSDLRSGTQWTVAYDTRNLTVQFHTMNNRRVRQLELKDIDFTSGKCYRRRPMDVTPEEDLKKLPGF
ncbi:choloylglycine hydrolase family protein [bacterium]|nr:choloylglycine hydrolase family protein [bacterium]